MSKLVPPHGAENLKPLIFNPQKKIRSAAISQFPRDRTSHRHKEHGDIMGYAVRTERFRYVQWIDWKSGKIIAEELYDHQSDIHETANVAGHAQFSSELKNARQILKESL